MSKSCAILFVTALALTASLGPASAQTPQAAVHPTPIATTISAQPGRATSIIRAPLAKFAGALRLHDRRLAASPADRDTWTLFIRDLEFSDRMSMLEAVNAAFNRLPYEADADGDDWAAPIDFLRRGAGDCEDYALAKYVALRDLGVPAEDLAIAVFVAPHIGAHAVLVVRAGEEMLILDNRTPNLLPAGRASHGRMIYAVNELGTDYFVGTTAARTATGGRGTAPAGRRIAARESKWPRLVERI